jgi:sec-independent protein translocase protein TatC
MSPITKSGKRAAEGMSIYEHLTEVRRRLLICLGAVIVMATVAFLEYNQILNWLKEPYCQSVPKGQSCNFFVTGPLDGLTLRIKIAFFGGLLLATPVLFYQIWRFITPGLRPKEKRYVIPFVTASIVFFVAGCGVAFFIFQRALKFLKSIGGTHLIAIYNPINYLNLIILMMVIFGIMFEFPVILVSLELANVVTPNRLLKSWRWAVIGIVVAAGVLVPSSDPFSMMALALPLIFFYFGSIGVGKLAGK